MREQPKKDQSHDLGAPETTPIFRLIRQVRKLLRTSWVATGLAVSIALYLGTLLVLSLVDLLVPLWPTMRMLALLLVVVPTLWALATGVLRPLLRRLANTQVARRIERHLPRIHNRLVSCVDLSSDQRRNGHSPEFYRRLVSETVDRIRSFAPGTVVDRRCLKRAGAAAGVALAAFLLALTLLSDRLPTALARIFSPFADIPPATGVEFTVAPGDARLLRGDDIEFTVTVTKGEPRDLRIEIQPGNGSQPIWHELQAKPGGDWTRTLHGFEQSFVYRVHGGGTWSKLHHIEMVDRPQLVDVHAVLHYPDYLALGDEGVVGQRTLDVTGPETSQVEIRAEVEGDVAEAEIQLLAAEFTPVPVVDREERVWFKGKLPEGAVAEGNWQWDSEKHQRPTHTEPAAAGVHGHLFHTVPVALQVRPDESLFAWVFLVPDQKPETVMLQWHDGQNWEHRAYWGEDKIGVGQPGTASRLPMGPLLEAGKWVRLEVPAAAVGVGGKSLKGMAFTLCGGQCYWHVAGALPAATRDDRRLVVQKTFAMQPEQPGLWSGSFPLLGEGLYRVEVRNELKIGNRTMKEAKYLAIVDSPPQVTLERPGTDLVLSQPKKVPLAVAAYDDFALKHIKVLAQRGDVGGFRETAKKTYETQVRGDTALFSLDLTPYDLKPGEHVRYRAVVEDRKGQIAETQDYVVRIATDDNAADRQLARFEQTQDTFQQKLVQLIAEQAKVRENVEKLAGKYAPLEQKLSAAEAKSREEARKAAEANPQAPPPAPMPQLDQETVQQLAQLRQELAQIAGQEEQNANVGKQLAAELSQAMQQAEQMRLLPPELLAEMKTAEQAFNQMAAQAMQALAQEMRQAATAAQGDPHVDEMSHAADRLQQELEAVAERLKALQRARQGLDAGMEQALTQLQQELMQLEAGDTARGLEELREMIAALREQLQNLEGKQAELLDATNVVPQALMPDVERQQANLDREEQPPLDAAHRLLDRDRPGRMKRKPQFPHDPLMGDDEETLTPPQEEDTEEPQPPDAQAEEAGQPHDGDAEEESEESLFEPALGGPRPKLDPRFADKRPKPMKQPPHVSPEESAAQARRQAMAEHQFGRLSELNLSQQSLGADERTLEELLEQLAQALEDSRQAMGNPEETQHGAPQGQPHPEQAERMDAGQLARLLDSPQVRQALELAQRLQQLQNAMAQSQNQPNAPQQGTPHLGRSVVSAPRLSSRGRIVEVDLSELDPATRALILRMQPKLREELLQGMREEGPEGYRKFIQDYFKRLSTVKGQ